jgi:hypothetical protein
VALKSATIFFILTFFFLILNIGHFLLAIYLFLGIFPSIQINQKKNQKGSPRLSIYGKMAQKFFGSSSFSLFGHFPGILPLLMGHFDVPKMFRHSCLLPFNWPIDIYLYPKTLNKNGKNAFHPSIHLCPEYLLAMTDPEGVN